MSEEKKKRLNEHQKNYHEAKKSKYNKQFNFNLIVIIIVF